MLLSLQYVYGQDQMVVDSLCRLNRVHSVRSTLFGTEVYDTLGRCSAHYWQYFGEYETSIDSVRYVYAADGKSYTGHTISYYKGPDTTYSDAFLITYQYTNGKLSRVFSKADSAAVTADTTRYYTYDPTGNLLESLLVQDESLEKHVYHYDMNNKVDRMEAYDNMRFVSGVGSVHDDTLHLSSTTWFTYDSLGRLATESPLPQYFGKETPGISYTYDQRGRLAVSFENLGALGNCAVDSFATYEKTTYTYSRNGVKRTRVDRIAQDAHVFRNTTIYRYNRKGLLKKEVDLFHYPLGGKMLIPLERDVYRYHYTYYQE